jgi:NADH-quinone oxidoreductase subunit J
MHLLSGLVIVVMVVALVRAVAPGRPLLTAGAGGIAAAALLVAFHQDLVGTDFWAGTIGFLAILSALIVVIHPNPMVSVLSLIVNILCLALFYLLLQAQTLAILQVIVYAGAIMVLFVFVIMLLNLKAEEGLRIGRGVQRWGAIVGGAAFATLLLWALRHRQGHAWMEPGHHGGEFGTAGSLGALLFGQYVFATEAASVLLIAAMVGAVLLAKRRLD